MRAWVGAFVLMAALTSPVVAGSEEDALQVVEKWAAAFNASDVDAIVALYAPDAMFLGTGAALSCSGQPTFDSISSERSSRIARAALRSRAAR